MRMLSLVVVALCAGKIATAAPIVLYSVELPSNYHYAGQPALNNADQVAVLAAHGDTYDVMKVTSAFTTILHSSTIVQPTGHSGASGFLPADPAINSQGDVAFESDSLASGDYAVYKWSQGTLTTLQSGSSGAGRVTQRGIDDNGNVLFSSGTAMTTLTGGTPIINSAVPSTRQITASIDSNGQVMYAREKSGPGGLSLEMRAIDTSGDHLLSSGAPPSGSPFHRLRFSINDWGMAAYVAGLNIYLSSIDNPIPTLLATAPTTIASVSINDSGDLAFSTAVSSPNGGLTHVYYQLAGMSSPDHLLGKGDAFLGGTISSVLIGSASLNDHGHLAVGYELTDGSVGIAVIAIPEPQFLLSISLAIAAVFLIVRSRIGHGASNRNWAR